MPVEGTKANIATGLVRQDIGLAVTRGADGVTHSTVDGNADEVFCSLAGTADRLNRFG